MNFEEWKAFMRHSIQAASIVQQVHDYIDEGRGPPGPGEMQRFSEEAAAISELWLEVVESQTWDKVKP